MMSGGRVLNILLSLVLVAACGYPPVYAGSAEDDVASALGLDSSSTEAFTATLISRHLESTELEDLAYHSHLSSSSWYDVGVGRHGEGSIAAARGAPEISDPRPEAVPGAFHVSTTGILMLDSDGSLILPRTANYESPPDRQIGVMRVVVSDPRGDSRNYFARVIFDASEMRWHMQELWGESRVPGSQSQS